MVFARSAGSEAMYCAGVLTFDGGFMDSSCSRTKCITERLKTSQRQGLTRREGGGRLWKSRSDLRQRPERPRGRPRSLSHARLRPHHLALPKEGVLKRTLRDQQRCAGHNFQTSKPAPFAKTAKSAAPKTSSSVKLSATRLCRQRIEIVDFTRRITRLRVISPQVGI